MALAAQGFAEPRPPEAGTRHILRALDRLGLFQIDSVNVLARAHYLPAFSRLGAYDRTALDRTLWGTRRERRCFEYWAHEASVLPLEAHPLFRWRMAEADRGEIGWAALRPYAAEHRPAAMAVLARVRDDGPLAASDLETGRTGWWAWSEPKRILEWLFWAGHLTTRTRRRGFERLYDLTERVIPADILALPTPSPADAHRALVERAARALGIATAAELRDYFRLRPAATATAIATLVEEGVLVPTAIEGWPISFRHRDARCPRRIDAHALLAPFDPLVFERTRLARLFGFDYRIEIYTPSDKRRHGYYVLPFLHGDRLAARVDLKADREAGILNAIAIHPEPDAPADTADALRAELDTLARWLGLDHVVMTHVLASG